MLEFLAVLLSLARSPTLSLPTLPPLAQASFRPAERAIGNWRLQAVLDIDIDAATAFAWLAGNIPPNLPRCIRLNNYWCLKKAGWTGEVAADPDGHAAFVSAAAGANAAIILLRHYYVDYGRKSARAIVSHWAPRQCELSVASTDTNLQSPATSLGPLAKFGLRNTLRARWLAAHGRGGSMATSRGARKVAMRRSVVPDRLAPATPEPPLVLELPIKTETLRLASISRAGSLRSPALAARASAAPPRVSTCAGENARLANYAARAIEGIAGSPDEDLKLFDADGSPLRALPRLLANMAAVEIGTYRADAKLIDAAIEAARRSAAERSPRPVASNASGARPGSCARPACGQD